MENEISKHEVEVMEGITATVKLFPDYNTDVMDMSEWEWDKDGPSPFGIDREKGVMYGDEYDEYLTVDYEDKGICITPSQNTNTWWVKGKVIWERGGNICYHLNPPDSPYLREDLVEDDTVENEDGTFELHFHGLRVLADIYTNFGRNEHRYAKTKPFLPVPDSKPDWMTEKDWNAMIEKHGSWEKCIIDSYKKSWERIEEFWRGGWSYVGVVVEIANENGVLASDGVWGVETDNKGYLEEVIRDTLSQTLAKFVQSARVKKGEAAKNNADARRVKRHFVYNENDKITKLASDLSAGL